ncbi:MAG: NADH:flavin oxidoreductase [bacterium]|nr:NADH:flavin oxidoreductase [bacterium]
MRTLFDETTFGNLRLKNRLVRSATGENLASAEGHIPKDLIKTYTELAKGGVGMILIGFTSVAPVDHFREGLMRLHDDSLIAEYKELADEIHKYDCVAMPQLALGIYLKNTQDGRLIQLEPDQMDDSDIKEIIRKFVSAASRAKQAGFDGVQLHGAHGFVLSKFMSPAYNHRTDAYGGSTEGRAKIVIDIIKEIKKENPDFHVSIKINNSDYIPRGLQPEESIRICELLEEAGLDSVEVSGNGPCVDGIRPGHGEGFFAPHAVELKKHVNIPVILTGGHRSVEHMEMLLNDYGIEYFSLSRPLIHEPGLPNRWKSGNTAPSKCISCNRCFGTYGHECIFKTKR